MSGLDRWPRHTSAKAPGASGTPGRALRVVVWHVHGAWLSAFVRGGHGYFLPTLPERGPWGAGRLGRDWSAVHEVSPAELRDLDVDVVVAQRPEELELCAQWLGRRPGRDVPAVFVEHNAPRGEVPDTRHPLAERSDIPIAHVTHFNAVMWDSGRAPTIVVEHGIEDPGERYTGELDRAAVVVNEPVRRWRVTGTDLLPDLARGMPLDVFGMGTAGLVERLGTPESLIRPQGDLPTADLHAQLARRRAYLHPIRWTSLGLSLIEAMQLGLPVLVLASTEAVEAVPPEAGVLSTRLDVLREGLRRLRADPAAATAMGKHARSAALARYGLAPFLAAWDSLLADVARAGRG